MAKKTNTIGSMTVAEAGRLGGTKVRDRHGTAFYKKIGAQGGATVSKLIKAGRAAIAKKG
jgi:hypothetical protein